MESKTMIVSFYGKVKDLIEYLNNNYKGEENGNTNDNNRDEYTRA